MSADPGKSPGPAEGSSGGRAPLAGRWGWLLSTLLLGGLVALLATVDLSPSLGHVDTRLHTGGAGGNYAAIGRSLSEATRRRGGVLEAITTDGSLDNVARLRAQTAECDAPFGLVQDGTPWPEEEADVRLLGRLRKAESVFFLGKGASRFTALTDLAGLEIAIGPEQSGTARLARALFGKAELAALGVVLRPMPMQEQLESLAAGQLALGMVVVDEDAPLIREAVLVHGLELAPLRRLDVLARRFPWLGHGRIGAGQFDAVAVRPAEDVEVLRVGTSVVVHGCARRSEQVALLTALTDVFPEFLEFNRDTPNVSGLRLADSTRRFLAAGGPDFLEVWLPRVADVMPMENWVYLVMGISVLFNVMGFLHRFRLWRIDAGRVGIELRIGRVFGPTTTVEEIGRMEPDRAHAAPETRRALQEAIVALERLNERCRSHSLSMLVPMGGEMAYRYQESLMAQALANLRAFRDRLAEA